MGAREVTDKDASGLVEQLTKWLRRRALPDSGLRYQERGFNDLPEIQFHGFDATFIARHMHGGGAEALADALTAQAEEIGRLRETIRDLAAAGNNLADCSNAIVGADTQDPDAAEAFDMFDAARGTWRIRARAALNGEQPK